MEVEYNKNIRIINTIYLLVLIIMSLYFGKVRSILFDGSYAVYKIYTFKTLIFAENRFPTVINCILPLIASKLNLSVKWILQAYIISYCILPIAVFIYLKCIAQNEKHVLVFLISISLFTFNIFFVPSHDALVGYYMVFILYSWLDSKPQISNKLYYIALFCLTNIIVFSHLSQTITIITLLGYFFIERKEKLYLSVVLSGILFSVLIKILFLTSSTEDNTLSGFGAMFDALKNISSDITIRGFIKSLFSYNMIFLVLFMLSLAVLVYTKHVLQGVYLLFSIIAILLFTACFFSNFKGYNFYTEMQYKPIGLLLSLLFSDYILIRFSQKNKNILVISIYVYTLLVLFAIGLDYNKYYNYVDSLVKTNKGNTMYFYNKKLKYEDIQMFLPLESTIINMYENSHCNFIGFRADTLTQKIGLIPDLSNDKKLCFKEPVVVKNAEIGMKEELELKFKWFINSNE